MTTTKMINRGKLDCLTSKPGAAVYSVEDSIEELNLACGQEQLKGEPKKTTQNGFFGLLLRKSI